MLEMEKGFYILNHQLYYDLYPKHNVERTIKLSSDKTTLACCKPENIKTDRLFSNEDVAVCSRFDRNGIE